MSAAWLVQERVFVGPEIGMYFSGFGSLPT